ncbi:MAG: hypothetical protein ICV79_27770, partial [Flavisolibacter sp.]|nr:hypothetical protein [Flavisolibacter sp.]
ITNGAKQAAAPVWQVYNGEIIPLKADETLQVNAMRTGYKPAVANYTNGKITPVTPVLPTAKTQ